MSKLGTNFFRNRKWPRNRFYASFLLRGRPLMTSRNFGQYLTSTLQLGYTPICFISNEIRESEMVKNHCVTKYSERRLM